MAEIFGFKKLIFFEDEISMPERKIYKNLNNTLAEFGFRW